MRIRIRNIAINKKNLADSRSQRCFKSLVPTPISPPAPQHWNFCPIFESVPVPLSMSVYVLCSLYRLLTNLCLTPTAGGLPNPLRLALHVLDRAARHQNPGIPYQHKTLHVNLQ